MPLHPGMDSDYTAPPDPTAPENDPSRPEYYTSRGITDALIKSNPNMQGAGVGSLDQFMRNYQGGTAMPSFGLAKDDPMGDMVLAGLIAFGGAGLTGLLPGTTPFWSNGASALVSGGMGNASLVGGAAGDTLSGGAAMGDYMTEFGWDTLADPATEFFGDLAGNAGTFNTATDVVAEAAEGGFSVDKLLSQILSSGGKSLMPSTGQDWMKLLMGAGSGIYGMTQADKLRSLAERYASQADPFAAYRSGYAAKLNDLYANPSKITATPGYEAGAEAVQRAMAAQGFQGSGNMAVALQKYGGDFFDREIQRLMQLSGANANPAAAGQIALTGNANALDLASKSLASLGYGFGGGQRPQINLNLGG